MKTQVGQPHDAAIHNVTVENLRLFHDDDDGGNENDDNDHDYGGSSDDDEYDAVGQWRSSCEALNL